MIRRPPRSTLFPTRRSSDLRGICAGKRVDEDDSAFAPIAALCRAIPARHREGARGGSFDRRRAQDRKSTRLNSSHLVISYAVFCLKKKKNSTPDCVHSKLVR